MRARTSSNGGAGSSAGLILLMLSASACFYIGGRLYQDARLRRSLLDVHEKIDKDAEAIATENVVRLSDLRAKEQQIAALQMELTEAKAAGFSSKIQLANATEAGAEKLLVVVGINTGFGQRPRRDSIRSTWMPKGHSALQQLEKEKGVVVRFVIGTSANKGDSLDRQIEEESQETQDFLILEDHVEGYDELPIKTQLYFTTAIRIWDAHFYFKVDDDVYINIERLSATLALHAQKPRVYIGCMKSGEIFTQESQKWHEPEYWKFGDAKMYFRHATGQIYGLTKAMAHYIAINRGVLHRYRNEDVSLGSWMIGLDADYVDDRAMCCSSPPQDGAGAASSDCRGLKASGEACIAVFDWTCSGLCNSVERMRTIHKTCGTKQLWE